MSIENMEKIIGRAVVEPAFRDLLFTNLAQAVAGYELTDDELAALASMSRESFDALGHQLERRVSKSSPLKRA